MLVFKKLTYKNFMACGNKPIEIILNDSHITTVTGNNGSGKSGIISSLFFVLYGKSFSNVNKNNLVNSINQKNCLVELELELLNTEYKIRRGIKPNIFEIYENNKLIPQNASIKEYQEWLQTNVLKMDEKTFRQIIVMGSTSFIPFMRLSAADRRTIIENLLCIEFFSEMNVIAKSNASNLVSELKNIEYQLKELNMKLEAQYKITKSVTESYQQQINELKQKEKNVSEEISSELDRCSELIKFVNNEEKETYISKQPSVNNQIYMYRSMIQSVYHEIENIKNKILFFNENKSCPYCSQTISDNLIIDKTNEYENQIVIKNDDIEKLKNKLASYQTISNKMQEKISELSENNKKYEASLLKLKNLKNSITTIRNQIAHFKQQITETQETDDSEITSLQEQINSVNSSISEYNNKIEAYNTILSLLKDDGIKSVIINNYLGTINLLLKKYIDAFDFNISFTFDENFNETLKSRNRDIFEYGSFSEGEKLKIDLALLFTFRELSKLRASVNTNLLIIDELDGKADIDTQTSINNLLSSLDCNIMIITHYPTVYESISTRQLLVTKENNFSRINVY